MSYITIKDTFLLFMFAFLHLFALWNDNKNILLCRFQKETYLYAILS